MIEHTRLARGCIPARVAKPVSSRHTSHRALWFALLVGVSFMPQALAVAPADTRRIEPWQVEGLLGAFADKEPRGVHQRATFELAELLGVLRKGDGASLYVPAPDLHIVWPAGAKERLARAVPKHVRPFLADPAVVTRLVAAGVLAELGYFDDAKPVLIELSARSPLPEYPDDATRPHAIRILARFSAGDEAIVELLKNISLGDSKDATLVESLWALKRLGAAAMVIDFVRERARHAGDRDHEYVLKCATQLGWLGDEKEASRLLVQLLSRAEPGSELQTDLTMALADFSPGEALPVVLRLLNDETNGDSSRFWPARAMAVFARRTPDVLNANSEQVMTTLRACLGRYEGDAVEAARALAALGHAELAVDGLLLHGQSSDRESNPRQSIVDALAELGEATRRRPDVIGFLRKTLADTTESASVRANAAKGLGMLHAREAAPDLRRVLAESRPSFAEEPGGHSFHLALAEALATLGETDGVPELFQCQFATTRKGYYWMIADDIVDALERAEKPPVIRFLEHAYSETRFVADARWLAHYHGRGSEDAEVLCTYLGQPQLAPELPADPDRARQIVALLGQVWDPASPHYSTSVKLREDAAGWVSWIIAQGKWGARDKAMLKTVLKRFEDDKANTKARAFLPAVRQAIEPLEVTPPWVRSLVVFGAVNVVATLLFALRPGRGGFERWLPFFVYAGGSVGSWLAGTATARLNLDPSLLAGLLAGELMVLVAAGVFSPAMLRHVARVEPINRVAIPVALRLPWSRRRIFRDYVASVRRQLERDRRQANGERYVMLPADVRTHDSPDPSTRTAPAEHVLASIAGRAAGRAHVLVEAPGGRGKSALLREVVWGALDAFETSPASSPVPVLLRPGDPDDGDSIETMTERALASALIAPDFLPRHLEAGDFILVVDGISESRVSEKVVSAFVDGPHGPATPLLLTSRPTRAFRNIIEGAARWMVVEPRRLDEPMLDKFMSHYSGGPLPDALRRACRGADGTYLPILVRMAMTIGDAGDATPASVADVYRGYFLKLFQAALPDEGERLGRLEGAARWCVETYWKDGLRRRAYDGSPLQQELRAAGVLVPPRDDTAPPPKEVAFFHDSMQGYLTAHGLAAEDRRGFDGLADPIDHRSRRPWDRGRVLLWTAANPKFARARSDVLQTGGTELFQMCLATFTPRQDLRRWLRDELLAWADQYAEDLRRRDVVNAVPPSLLATVKDTRGAAKLLSEAAQACYEADDATDAVASLGTLYAGMAALVYELSEGADSPAAPAVSARVPAVATA